MKLNILLSIFLLSIFLPILGHSQDTPMPVYGRLNFAVPDMPAFKMLGTEPSTIMRPTTPKEIAATVSQFYGNGGGILPQNIALELAPFILIDARSNSNLTISNFKKREILHSIRLSVGTLTDSAVSPNVNKLSVGLRISLLNKGDERYDEIFLNKIGNVLIVDAVRQSELTTEFNKINPLDASLSVNDQTKREKELQEFIKNRLLTESDEIIQELKKDYKLKNWNKAKIDLAFATSGLSSDSLVKNLTFNRYSGWLTGAFPVKTWGQILIGANYIIGKNMIESGKEYLKKFSLSTRFYAGTNRFKGYLEGQFNNEISKMDRVNPLTINSNLFYLNLGGEYGILDSVWIQGYAGYEYDFSLKSRQFIGHVDLRFTIPEKL